MEAQVKPNTISLRRRQVIVAGLAAAAAPPALFAAQCDVAGAPPGHPHLAEVFTKGTDAALVISGRVVGLVVDSAREFASIPPDAIRPLPEGIGGMSGRYLRGVAQQGERLILVIDVGELLTGAMVDAADVDPTETAHAVPSP